MEDNSAAPSYLHNIVDDGEELVHIIEHGLNEDRNSEAEYEIDEPQIVANDESTSDSEIEYIDNEDGSPSAANIAGPALHAPRFRAGRPAILPIWNTREYSPIICPFDESCCGPNNNTLTQSSSEGAVYEHFFDEHILLKICDASNNYAQIVLAGRPNHHQKKWSNITLSELNLFFAITMLMTRKKALELHEYWSTNRILTQSIFPQLMSRDRYRLILTVLHWNKIDNENANDKLTKLRPFIEYITLKFKSSFKPYENLCIDESLVLFKGRLHFKQYIPSKRSRFGVKIFVMCDAKTDYILDFIIYIGSNSAIEDRFNLGQSGAVVTTLLEDYFEKGHTIYLDNWYTSPALFRVLQRKQTNACGMVRKNRIGLPKFGKLQKGQVQAKYTDNMMAFKWHDRRDVHFLSTFHQNQLKPTGKIDFRTRNPILKPEAIIDYNKNMGSVDKMDMLLSSVRCLRKSKKWYRKIGLHLFDLIMLNSHSFFKTLTGRESYPLADFQLRLIDQIVEKYHSPKMARNPVNLASSCLRLTGRHFPAPTPSSGKKENPFRRCHVCSHTKLGARRRKMTKIMCTSCNVALCTHPCFEKYHTLAIY